MKSSYKTLLMDEPTVSGTKVSAWLWNWIKNGLLIACLYYVAADLIQDEVKRGLDYGYQRGLQEGYNRGRAERQRPFNRTGNALKSGITSDNFLHTQKDLSQYVNLFQSTL